MIPADLDQANRAYSDGHYAQAAQGYAHQLQSHGYSAPVLYDLGNASFRLGQIGEAVLNYERAQLLAPADAEVAANLRFVRQSASLTVPPLSWYQRAAGSLSLDGWSWAFGGGLWLLCAALLLHSLVRRARPLLSALAVAGALALGGAGTALWLERPVLQRAVVMAKDAPVLLSPFESARPLFALPEGDRVHVTQRHGGYARITTEDGRSGWMEQAQVRTVMPD